MPDRAEQLKRMLEDDPHDAFCLYGLAQEHAKEGELISAIACYDRAIESDPGFAYAFFHKAKAQERLGDAASARATLEAARRAAREADDPHALSEIDAYIDELDR